MTPGQPAQPLKVALVCMPWMRADTPSIQCGLLKAVAAGQGHDVTVYYLNLELAGLLGADLYGVISAAPGKRQNFLGEWLFTVSAFGSMADQGPSAVAEYLGFFPDLAETLGQRGIGPARLEQLRDSVLPDWVARHARAIVDSGRAVAGFSSTFEQNVASIAMARQIKLLDPDVVTVFGGANVDGEMGPEFLRVLPCIDYVVVGEGDHAFPALLESIAGRRLPVGIPGVRGRVDGAVAGGGTGRPVTNMNALPVPDFDEYFATLGRLGRPSVLGRRPVRLVYESSRGCWWGEKHHCTFCGLNRLAMTFRAKTGDQAFSEIAQLAGKYRVNAIDTVDNILDMDYLSTLCARLREAPWDPSLFFEIKANLSRSQLRSLRQAGIERIQPGLESLSSHVLTLMRKGTTLLINAALLKWARFYGIDVIWGIITGFPGELDKDYAAQIDLIPSLYHLPPPSGTGPIWLERFSPYFTEDFPIRDVRPCPAYRFIYPVPGIDLSRVAYFFDYVADGVASADVRERLGKAVGEWQERWAAQTPPELSYVRGPGWLTIRDTRGREQRQITMSGWQAVAYEFCGDKARGVARIREFLRDRAEPGPGDDEVGDFLRVCLAERLMLAERDRYLSLALPAPERC
jgi:ribosomal peptide maturation radical SAM protein 1